MKKYQIIALLLALFVSMVACGNGRVKQKAEETAVAGQEQVADDQPSSAVTEQRKFEPGEVYVLSTEEFVNLITDIDNPKGFQYKGSQPCIVDFYADWCGPCHVLNPILMEMAAKYKDKIAVYKVNVDKSATVAEAFHINSIPTLIFFTPHTQPAMIVGAPSKEDLDKAIRDLLLK